MKILVVGGGGREHAIIWKLRQNPEIDRIYCAPGNGGISEIAECADIAATDFDALIAFAKNKGVDFTVIGPDDPLSLGIADAFTNAGLDVFGPNKDAAIIEGSKAYAKELMKKYGIPTAGYEVFGAYEKASAFVKTAAHPLVIKADGLALGKGVIICENEDESEKTLKEMMLDKKFGKSGSRVVIEEFLTGPEVTVLAFCDGKTLAPMVPSQDHKRALDGDFGLNTGGMGAFSPSRHYTEEIADICREKIFIPTVNALIKEGRPFKGVIYFGLILTKQGPKVIEYNARFGDPEAQAVLSRLETDLLTVLKACVSGELDKLEIKWKNNASACVVMASGGYPEGYQKGFEITGLENFQNADGLTVFHSGTKRCGDKFLTDGGRVLGVTGTGATLDEAISLAYDGAGKIKFENAHYRKDIGTK